MRVKIYCSGIGGIGLSAYAALQNANGHDVLGSDRALSALTNDLESQGISVSDIQDGKVVLKPGTFELVQNAILSASSVESLLISREIKLPPAVQLPRVTLKPSDEVAKDNTVELKNEKEEEKKD